MYVNMNLNRNAVLSCTRLALSHQPPLPPPAVLTDYYYGNPLAYACKKKKKKNGYVRDRGKSALLRRVLSVLYWIFLRDERA